MTAARYLAYGLMAAFSSEKTKVQAAQLERGCIDENQTFTVRLCFCNHIDHSILNALKAVGLFGGPGSRSRNGMGSIALDALTCVRSDDQREELWQAPSTPKEYDEAVRSLFPEKRVATEPPFTAFSAYSKIDRLFERNSPFVVLNSFGHAMLDYRSWGQSGKGNELPGGKVSEKRFKDDHDWFRVAGWRKDHPNFHPQRVIFGLPHNYHKDNKHHVTPSKHERRASPLFFHVHKIGNSYLGLALRIRSAFLPQGEHINTGGRNVPAKVEWSILDDFIEGTDKQGKLRFPSRRQVDWSEEHS